MSLRIFLPDCGKPHWIPTTETYILQLETSFSTRTCVLWKPERKFTSSSMDCLSLNFVCKALLLVIGYPARSSEVLWGTRSKDSSLLSALSRNISLCNWVHHSAIWKQLVLLNCWKMFPKDSDAYLYLKQSL